MSKFTKLLKEEISRLARKEVRKKFSPLRSRVIDLNREVSGLKKELDKRDKKISRLEKLVAEAQPAPVPASKEEVKKARISPRLIKIQRKRLDLNQSDFARLIGVSVSAVRSWEQGRSAPRGENLASFVAVRKLSKREAYDRLGLKLKRKKRKSGPKKKTGKKK